MLFKSLDDWMYEDEVPTLKDYMDLYKAIEMSPYEFEYGLDYVTEIYSKLTGRDVGQVYWDRLVYVE